MHFACAFTSRSGGLIRGVFVCLVVTFDEM
jgi:hypothetical protein